ncbi:cysteine hydrolase family protein [Paraburkholderia sp. J12]|uniref:cysteine hydrolase family protein n=1 Tax=Paraburkholderia sp. J12 TaxID=2805432 RepID=UPI002ABE66DB|nr:cysteine hydrolase family protein [Paraburkholderia sp. J12]
MHEPHRPRRALLVIDIQQGMFAGPERPHDGDRVLANINTLVRKAREAQAPVFAARHTGPPGSPLAPGSALSQLLPELLVDERRDGVFDKTLPNCFHGTPLAGWLAEADIGELVIAGMKTQYCVDSTCRAAADLGLRPVLIADAHTCMDTPALGAAAIVAHHNATLAGPFVRLASTADYAF